MKIIDTIILIGMAVLLIAPWFLAGLYIWGWLAVCVGLLVVGFEIYSLIKYDRTISRTFSEFRKEHPKTAYSVLTGASIGWILLMVHLLC